MENISIIISILALLLTVFTYFKHDQKIKKQEKLLNEYHLTKMEAERVESRKAKIEANVIKVKECKNAIKVYNKGQAIARNVNVLIVKSEGFNIISNPCPIDIRPQNSIELVLLLSTNYPEKIKIDFEWSDDFIENNRESQYVQLL